MPNSDRHTGKTTQGALDDDVVRTWFDVVLAAEQPPGQGVTPDPAERATLRNGRELVVAALHGRPLVGTLDPTAGAGADSGAGWLAFYLTGFAAGLSSARVADAAPPGTATPLHLAAGLITGAASATAVEPASGPVGAAHRAGAAAAEEAVAGADLYRVARAAADAAGRSDAAADGDDRRTRLLSELLAALVTATRPAPQAHPIGRATEGFREQCVRQPWLNEAAPFLAEITFSTVDHPESAQRLAAALTERGESFGTWSDGDTKGFHIHTREPGAVLAEVYSVLTPFDLVIGRLPD